MKDYQLSPHPIAELEKFHRHLRDKRQADRVKSVIVLSKGWSAAAIAEILLLDDKTSRGYFHRYVQGGCEALLNDNHPGAQPKLDEYERIKVEKDKNDPIYFAEATHPQADVIYIIVNNARYYRSSVLTETLEGTKIKLIFLSPYSPNLNLIEWYWKFFKKKVTNHRYYETFAEFVEACKNFFRKRMSYLPELQTLLTENFHIQTT